MVFFTTLIFFFFLKIHCSPSYIPQTPGGSHGLLWEPLLEITALQSIKKFLFVWFVLMVPEPLLGLCMNQKENRGIDYKL